jgi:hypothetical protein
MSPSQLQANILPNQATAQATGYGISTLRRWHKQGQLHGIVVEGKIIGFARDEVQAFIRAGGPKRARPGRKPKNSGRLPVTAERQ